MVLGDQLAQQALKEGQRITPSPAPPGIVRLAIALGDGSIQHFERLATGTCGDWRATDFESPGSGFAFNEPVTAEWGRGLDVLATAQ
ncbi:hypothetical protein OG453_07725 [Streptomyces sp. NBC_01381]|uniref:hypothetical protein n=1 Tax=Streptomyces sp. NBC_01381 TaxID=2903845 RepID=UPI00224FFE03|nr:hypothetical protein [Streptomyces sp. NBC_01381]MCX4666559.1 hypothetical protein [Streptomyces sp. NBC_01381]